jgi:hypothetical protein
MRDIILVGGGSSVTEGLELGLWDKLKDREVWSINYAFMTMPYLPSREVWVDVSFFQNNMEALQKLHSQGVKCYAKKHMKYAEIPEITTCETTRDPKDMEKRIFIGRMGLSGFFALHLATKEIADRIFLLGYDFGAPTRNTHYYQSYLKVQSTGFNRPELYREGNRVKEEVKDFELFTSPGIKAKIYNVSTISAIQCFEKIDYLTFFTKLEEK